jgi:hypothetical protein
LRSIHKIVWLDFIEWSGRLCSSGKGGDIDHTNQ